MPTSDNALTLESAAYLPDAVCPAKQMEHDDVYGAVEYAFRAKNRVLERNAHVSCVREHCREAHGSSARLVPFTHRDARKQHPCEVGEHGGGKRQADADKRRPVKWPLERCNYEARRDNGKNIVGDALYARRIEDREPAHADAEEHQQKQHRRLVRNYAKTFEHRPPPPLVRHFPASRNPAVEPRPTQSRPASTRCVEPVTDGQLSDAR